MEVGRRHIWTGVHTRFGVQPGFGVLSQVTAPPCRGCDWASEGADADYLITGNLLSGRPAS